MLIAMTGSRGFLGRALSRRLAGGGHTVVPVSREPGLLPKVDAVVHLAGEPIGGRWTARRRRAILESRVELTRRLVDRMGDSTDRPGVLVSASGTGIYGDRPGETLTEDSAPGRGFRTEVCRAWEAEAARAKRLGIRTAILRFGAILDPSGGILEHLLPWHRRGLSFVLGGAGDPLAWIGLFDAVDLVAFCLNEPVAGPVNGVFPEPATQEDFARILAAREGHRLRGRIPTGWLRALLGEMARALVDRQDVRPEKALRLGFAFRQDLISACLGGEPIAPRAPLPGPEYAAPPAYSMPYSRSLL